VDVEPSVDVEPVLGVEPAVDVEAAGNRVAEPIEHRGR
jgi:hypothetical protein